MTYREMIHEAALELQRMDVPESDWEAKALLLAVLKWQLADYALKSAYAVSEEDRIVYEKALAERLKHVPLQRIVSSASFMGYEFLINEDTLIPRDDSEVLVRAAAENVRKRDKDPVSVLDMCTGSGCLILALALTCPEVSGTGVDIAPKAVEASRQNAEKLDVRCVSFACSDLFSNVTGTYDIIISNPPYIPSADIPGLEQEVRCYEPWIALDGGQDGLDFYREIIQKAPAYLKDGGSLLFEIGYDEGESVRHLMEAAGFENVAVVRDLAGLNRVVQGDIHV